MLTGLGLTGTMLFIVRLVFAFNDLVYNAAIGTGTAMTSGGPGGTSNDSFLFFKRTELSCRSDHGDRVRCCHCQWHNVLAQSF